MTDLMSAQSNKEKVKRFTHDNKHVFQQWREDGILWMNFQKEFSGWTEEIFRSVAISHLTELRKILRSRGVYVNQSENVANALYNTVVESSPSKWTDYDVRSMDKKGQLLSKSLLRRAEDLRRLGQSRGPNREDSPYKTTLKTMEDKAYSDCIRFGDDRDDFCHVLARFHEICTSYGIPQNAYGDVFWIALRDEALDYYTECRYWITLRDKTHDYYGDYMDPEPLTFGETCHQMMDRYRMDKDSIRSRCEKSDGFPDIWSINDQPSQIMPNYGAYSTEFTNIAKEFPLYEKFSGNEKSMDKRFARAHTLFRLKCMVERVPEEFWGRGLHIMLKGPALDFYRYHLQEQNWCFSKSSRALVSLYDLKEEVLEERR